ncbi:hypothetical protein Afil01_12580 [Actinorhabdospora filicis]|uniref:Uncharacterized protein n=1 Tax=Actinorhabdospora filicis TaxID=1785913 RepID=A0A9W6SKU6_9ACTN|nr:hypothetical protein [Actinorhabdospora filicis]GLZ76451.1 hypothetical protein Afil01_12580 [Actinorhabdospora filicis]
MKLIDRMLNRLVPASKAAAGTCGVTSTWYQCRGTSEYKCTYDSCKVTYCTPTGKHC